MSFVTAVSAGAVRAGTSVMYASLGEVIAQRAGITNLGVEGCMLAGACAAYIVAAETGSPYLGIIAAFAAGGLFAMLHAFLVVTRGANQLASGLALMFLGLGMTAFFGRPYVKVQITPLRDYAIPGLSDLPYLGSVLFHHDVLTYAVFPLAGLLWWFVFRSRWGVMLRAVGESTESAFAVGLHPARIQYAAVTFGGALAGLGGAQISLAYAATWVENLTQGRGFIAVALVIFAMWNPLRAMVGALLFGGAVALQLQLQARGVGVSPLLLDMTPYLLTIVVLLVWAQRGRDAFPAGLTKVFRGTG
ncbi:MAG: ABC transporter permease [Candidatus Rokubacteria bacterium]|nr:ABC transporter permease [Chloroflexota bacterium]MBM4442724.1 ABC transporter permease [Candidatus Rokubacteria bacterium]